MRDLPDDKKEIIWQQDSGKVNFTELADLLNRAFDAELEPVNKPGWEEEKEQFEEELRRHGRRGFTADHVAVTFSRSYAAEYGFYDGRLVAAGRMLSDGIEQAAIYNIAVDPSCQGLGLGREIIERLLRRAEGCEVILYTHPQTVKFYETLGFRRQKTGFVTWPGRRNDQGIQKLEETGFILPAGYRYETDESDYYEKPHRC